MRIKRSIKAMTFPTSWQELPLGEFYQQTLECHLQQWWPKLFGQYLLKIGDLSAELDTTNCVAHQTVSIGRSISLVDVVAIPEQLPFLAKSFDICLLAHTLSYSEDPHSVLREADRVLDDDGWLIITGYNPYSLLGVGSILPIINKYQPYSTNMFSSIRIIDWLSLLNYEIVYRASFQILPFKIKKNLLIRQQRHFLGCFNIIIARKRTIPITLNPQFLWRRRLLRHPVLGAARGYWSK